MLLEKLKNYRIYLASKSPRRHELIQGMGIDFSFLPTDIEEIYPENLSPVEVTEYLSRLKLSEIHFSDYPGNAIFIACDTIVTIEEQILEKPATTEEAAAMLRYLSGKEHTVISGLTVASPRKQITSHRKTRVRFKNFTDEEIEYYVSNYKPLDKAGAYGVQEWIGYIGIDYIEGSFYNVMGLPTKLLWDMLHEITN